MALFRQAFLELACEFLVVLYDQNPHLCFCSIPLVSEESMSSQPYSSNPQIHVAQWVKNGNRMRVLLLLITVLRISAGKSELIRFDQAVPGKLPADWTVAMTHAGAPPHWEIVRDESAPRPPNVLAQLSRDRT